MHGRARICQHVLCEGTIVFETSHLTPLAKARIKARRSAPVLLAAYATSTGFFEVQYPDAISDLPWSQNFTTDFDNTASWLMRRNHGKLRDLEIELALQDLKIRVAKACRVHLNEEIMFATQRHRTLAQLVRFIVLVLVISLCCFEYLVTSRVTFTICAACIVSVAICGVALVNHGTERTTL